jgi:hypothetical protein
MTQIVDPQLMQAGDRAFWEEFEERQNPADRYIVVDTKKQEVVVQNARLVREMKKIRV